MLDTGVDSTVGITLCVVTLSGCYLGKISHKSYGSKTALDGSVLSVNEHVPTRTPLCFFVPKVGSGR